ncbi:MAG: hypothetical protein KC620_04450, partial [Myxococcales bacterium]|nr:hypothetical protein [Myxococcales bacterium]
MESEVFQLLPARGIDRSLLLAVLAGLWILFFFAEVYGWVFTGLVVPGYLAAVFVVQPVSGAAIVTEGLLTFLLARGISDLLARTGAWSRFFGRERFFLILLISVLVRQHCELWLFPLGIEVLGERFGVELTFQHEFFGVGLVLVPLLSNMFWKLSTWRGLVQIGVPTALTYALLALVILPLTNYGLTSLELTYEDVAVNFLGTAKIYIILLVTAFLAAQMNLYAGWDYGGILVPALLAVAWFTPLKVLTTVAEALVLAAVVSQAMRVWPLRKLNLESGRKMVVVFTIGFELKVAIAWGIGDAWPGLDVTDLFGFGYLMPSLLAVKMLNRRAIGRVLGPTLAVSAAGLVFGSVLGLALERVVVAAGWSEPVASAPAHPTQPAAVADAVADPLALALMAHLRAVPQTGPAPARRPEQQERVGTLWRQIDRWLAAGQIEPPAAVETRRRALGFALARLG